MKEPHANRNSLIRAMCIGLIAALIIMPLGYNVSDYQWWIADFIIIIALQRLDEMLFGTSNANDRVDDPPQEKL